MNTRLDLDTAIDRVAARLTQVDDDPQLASRIVASLPERSTWFGGWVPRLAALALIVAATAAVLRMFDDRSTAVLRSSSTIAVVTEFTPVIASRIEARIAPDDRRTIVEPPLNDLRTAADFDRSLPPVAAPVAVDIAALSAGDLPAERALLLEPLDVPSLSLTAESFPERD